MAADKDEDAELGLMFCSALPDSAIDTDAFRDSLHKHEGHRRQGKAPESRRH